MVVNVIMKRYFTGAIKYGLFFFFLLSSAHSFAQETGWEQVLQFECTAINIGTLSEDDAPVTYHFKYCNVSKKTVRISKLTTSCGCTVAKCNKDLVQPGERINLEFDMPSRGIIGLRTNVLTASAGEAIMAHRFKEYQPYKGEIERRTNGSMIAMESGTAFAYAIDKLQDRGKFFIFPQDEVYAGQVVGEHSHDNDLVINVTKSKKLTNMRASGSDDKVRLIPPVQFSLEEALEYIKEDEYVEVTPKAMRMRKVILDEIERKRANKI